MDAAAFLGGDGFFLVVVVLVTLSRILGGGGDDDDDVPLDCAEGIEGVFEPVDFCCSVSANIC